MDDRETALLDQVRALARGPFAERAEGYDRQGCFPRENVADLTALGLPALSLSRDIGGLGLSPEAQMRVMEEIAYGDASTAVALNMHRIGADLVALLPPFPRRDAVLNDIARNNALICAPGSIPSGELDSRRSGFRVTEQGADLCLSGRTGFASMSEGAKYVFVVGTIEKGAPPDGTASEPDFVFALPDIDAPGIKLLYNWDAMGLRGTASHDVEVDGLLVPRGEALVLPAAMLRMVFQAVQQQGGVAGQFRSLGTLGILAIWLGLAQAAYDFTIEYVSKRYGYLAVASPTLGAAPGLRSEQPWAQAGIGNMEHWLETGRIIFYDTVRRIGQPFPSVAEFTRTIVRAVYHLRRMTEEVAMGAMKVCGAHAYVRARPLERIVRDLLGGVVMAWKTDELVQTIGRGALGLPITLVGPAGS